MLGLFRGFRAYKDVLIELVDDISNGLMLLGYL